MMDNKFANELARRVAEFFSMNPTIKTTDPVIPGFIAVQIQAISGEFEDDKKWAKAFISSTCSMSNEKVIIDICIPRDPAYLEDIEHYFNCVRRRLQHDMAKIEPVVEPSSVEPTEATATP